MRSLFSTSLIAITLILSSWAHCVSAQAPDTPASMDDAFAAIVIGDFKGLVDGVSGIVNQVMPGMGAMIPAQVGGFFGDPQLSGFEEGDGVVGIIFPGDLTVAFAEVNEDQHEAYIQKCSESGLQAASVGSVLVLSDDPVGIETGKKIANEVVENLLTENPNPSLHALVHVPKIMKTYRKEIDGFIEGLPQMMEQGMAASATKEDMAEGMGKFLEAEVYFVYNLASQLDIFEVELSPGQDGISLEVSFMPAENTNFQTLLAESKGGDVSKMVSMVPADGAIRAEAGYDVAALQDYTKKEIDKILTQVDWPQEEKDELKSLADPYLKVYGSGFVASMLGDEGGDTFMTGYYLCDVENPDEAVEFFKEMNSQFDAMGLTNLYDSMGIEMTFEFKENVKEHQGIPIHQLAMNMDLSKMENADKEGMADLMKAFSNFTYDVCIVDGYLAYTVGGSSIETLIDLIKKGGDPSIPPLASKKHFGEGGSYYGDLSLEGYLRMFTSIMKGMPQEDESFGEVMKQIESVKSVFAGAPPISAGLFADREQAKFKLYIPSLLLQKVSQAVMGVMMSAGASGGN
ncbi:MAG: hypothetical protein KC944_16625 [Candidatus Omnitrophica bacterium]|nr:hypothetical protein [Candidatus Omnitrophota bacterium]